MIFYDKWTLFIIPPRDIPTRLSTGGFTRTRLETLNTYTLEYTVFGKTFPLNLGLDGVRLWGEGVTPGLGPISTADEGQPVPPGRS